MKNGNSDGLTVRFHGVRGSVPSPSPQHLRYGGNTSCVELRAGNQLLILDAGSGLRILGEELAAAGSPVRASLLLSHAHWDHIQGLPFFAPGYSSENRIEIFAAAGYGARMQRALANQMSPPHFPVSLEQMRGLVPVRELSPASNVMGNFSIRTIELNHPGGCAGFRISVNGVTLAYLPDHEPYGDSVEHRARQSALIAFIREVDLLILDTQYTQAEYARRIGWGHGYLQHSVALAVEANVHRLAFFHHDPSHSDAHIDDMVNDATMMIGPSRLTIEAAAETEVIELAPHQSLFGVTSTERPSRAQGAAPLPDWFVKLES